MPTERRHGWYRWLIGLAVIGALVLLVRHRAEPARIAHVLAGARPAWLLLAAVFQLLTYPCMVLLWIIVIKRAGGTPPSFARLMRLSVAELFADQTIPSAGMSGTLLVVASLKKQGVTQRAAMASVVSSLLGFYLAQLIAIIAAAIVIIAHDRYQGWEITACIVATVAAIVIPIPLVVSLAGVMNKLPKRIQRIAAVAHLRDHLDDAPLDVVLAPPVLSSSIALRLAVLLLDGATLAAALAAVGHPISLALATVAFVLAYVLGTASFLPGGLGTFEIAATSLLVTFGAPIEAAAPATLIMRALSFWLPMIPGMWFTHHELGRHGTTSAPEGHRAEG